MIEAGDLDTRQPYEGESLYGLIAAVTADNDLIRVRLIARVADQVYGHYPQLSIARRDELLPLAEVLEVDVEELEHRSYRIVADDPGRRTFFGTTVARSDVRTTKRFFSPAALAAHPFHRAMWQLRIPFDINTGEVLVSTCPHCEEDQRWRHSAGVAFCDRCGASLDQPTDRIDHDVLPEAALAVGLTHSDTKTRAKSLALLPGEISSLGAATAYEMLLRLVPVVEPACTWNGGDRLWRNDPHDIARGLHNAWNLLLGWPLSMTDRISRDVSTSRKRHSDGNRGQTQRFLGLRRLAHIPSGMREVIERLHESINVTGPNAAEMQGRTMICREVSRTLSYGSAQLVAMRRSGVFRTIGILKGAMMVAAFDRAEILEVASDVRRRRDLLRANALLGLPHYAVEQLAALGHLPPLEHPYFAARYKRPQTTAEAINSFVDELIDGASPRATAAIPILMAMQMMGGRLKPWDAVVEAMVKGDLNYSVDSGEGPLFARVRVLRDDLLPHLAQPITRDGAKTPLSYRIPKNLHFLAVMTKIDAGEVLNLADRQAAAVLRAYPGTTEPNVPIADVQRIALSHVANTEIANLLGVAPQSVRSVARRLGIPKLSEAGYDRARKPEIVAAVIQWVADAEQAKR